MASYIHWQDYYKTEFLHSYNNFFSLNVKKKSVYFYNNFFNLFNKSCSLLRYYLNNYGLYQFSELDVIRESFYIELIEDGDAWMDVLKAASFIKNDVDFANNIDFINLVSDKYYYVFKKLKNKVEGLL